MLPSKWFLTIQQKQIIRHQMIDKIQHFLGISGENYLVGRCCCFSWEKYFCIYKSTRWKQLDHVLAWVFAIFLLVCWFTELSGLYLYKNISSFMTFDLVIWPMTLNYDFTGIYVQRIVRYTGLVISRNPINRRGYNIPSRKSQLMWFKFSTAVKMYRKLVSTWYQC